MPIPKWYVDQYYEDVEREEREFAEQAFDEYLLQTPAGSNRGRYMHIDGMRCVTTDDLCRESPEHVSVND